ncbi:MAG: hypothetical protein O3A47_12750, partial [Chloroflexi bacterium]|nr:hypothetical protein [Chloroflexota bacterium]
MTRSLSRGVFRSRAFVFGFLAAVGMIAAVACAGEAGPPGPPGPAGPPGPPGQAGAAAGTGSAAQNVSVGPMASSITDWKWINEWPFDVPLPDHLFVDVGGGKPLFLHFDKPVTETGKKLLWVGTGQKGRFYLEEQPNAAYTHFHRLKSPTPDAGHGGSPGADGYWLIHAAATSFDSMMSGGPIGPGVDFNFMPTVPTAANTGTEVAPMPASATGWKWQVDWPFDAPLPEHEWLDLGNGEILFLHYDKPVSESGKNLMFIGLGIRGRFCAGEEPGPAFTHFHRLNAPTPDAGHGG